MLVMEGRRNKFYCYGNGVSGVGIVVKAVLCEME